MVKICVSGSKGKMGSSILELVRADAECEITGEFDIDGDAVTGIEQCECLIEFTSPEATIAHLELCVKGKKAMVIGTTALSDAEREKVSEASKKIPIVLSPNMSIAVNLLFKVVGDAARTLGPEYSIEIVEAHHTQKKDSPSGTAKEIARIIKDAKGDIKVPIESIREDEIVGEHTITFDSLLDTIEFTHSAKSRDIFAAGALKAAKFIATKKSGLFTMNDVLGL